MVASGRGAYFKAVSHHEISWSTMVRAVVVVASTWIAVQLLPVVLVLVVALFLVGTLNPAVEWLERHHRARRPRWVRLVPPQRFGR